MKNYGLILLLILSSFCVNAQLFVGPNSYVYVNNEVLFVTQDVELNAASSNVYLRNSSQLLQGTTGAGVNKGTGSLSVYQEGTTNNFQYNYWCSPVGGSIAAAGNSPFGITQFGTPTTSTATTSAVALPSNNPNGTSSVGTLSIASRWIYTFTTGTAYSQWNSIGSASLIGAGQGFTMKGTSGTDTTVPHVGATQNHPASGGQRYDFRGKPNDGTINVPVGSGLATLSGNPYPSAIDMNMLLADPLSDGTALYWEHDKSANSHNVAQYRGGYGVYNGTSGIYTPATFYTYTGAGNQGAVASTPFNSYERRFAPVGQGFMLRGAGNGNIQIKNQYRVYRQEGFANNSQFERNSNSTADNNGNYEEIPNVAGTDYTQISRAATPNIKINVGLNNQAVRQLVIAFLPNAADGLDRADSKSADILANLPFDSYLFLDNTEYVHSATNFAIDKVFPIGFKNNANATFRIQVASLQNVNQVDNVYLHDKVTGQYHDIKNAEYEVSLPVGANNERFEITLQDATLTVDDTTLSGFSIFENNTANQLVIKNPNGVDIKSCTLYDILGKEVLKKTKLGSAPMYEFNTVGLRDGVYIVKLVTVNNQEVTKKIVILQKK